MIKLAQCIKCTHRAKGNRCLAYPDGIPFMVFSGETPHNQILEGQINDYVYTPKEKYVKHDVELSTASASLDETICWLEDEVSRLFFDNVSSWAISKGGWDRVQFDFELLGDYGVKVNDLYVLINGGKACLDSLSNSELWDKFVKLLKIHRLRSKSIRLNVILWPDQSVEFKYMSTAKLRTY